MRRSELPTTETIPVRELKPGQAFVTSGRGALPNDVLCSFLYDENGRYTRLWDGAYVDGFFDGRDGHGTDIPVVVVDWPTAVQIAKDYRSDQ